MPEHGFRKILSTLAAIDKYEPIIGLEVHAQLLTESKAFAPDSATYGAPPNTHISTITLGHPGTLPVINKKMFDFALRMGLACQCEIARQTTFARKHYCYPDLPKGYQISQHAAPICKAGRVPIRLDGVAKDIRLHHIHLEEDAGKSLHDRHPHHSYIDLNRAGTPLIEIVTEPDLRSSAEAFAFLTEVRAIVRYLDICDGNMEEGSLRCDANVSVRPKGEKRLAEKVEIKNLNSIRNVKRALDAEIKRQVALLEKGGMVSQQTRSYDAERNRSFPMRTKEMAHDYRYFPEPDLPPVVISDAWISEVRSALPELPHELFLKYTKTWCLPASDAAVLVQEKAFARYFEEVCACGSDRKTAANWMIGPVKAWLNEQGTQIADFPLNPDKIAALIAFVEQGNSSASMAAQRLLPKMIGQPEQAPETVARQHNLTQDVEAGTIEALIDETLAKFPGKVKAYHKGRKGLFGLFMGEVMKATRGKADPQTAKKILTEKLQKTGNS